MLQLVAYNKEPLCSLTLSLTSSNLSYQPVVPTTIGVSDFKQVLMLFTANSGLVNSIATSTLLRLSEVKSAVFFD